MADFGQAPKKETVYQGPTDQTIYNGAPAAQPAPARAVATTGAVSPAVRGGASWFYWIGVLSLINTILTLSSANFHFIFGLGITQVADVLGQGNGATGAVLALVVNGFIAAFFAIFGFFGSKGQKWAFIVGMLFYALDGGLCLLAKDMLTAAFHGWALFRMYLGMKAID